MCCAILSTILFVFVCVLCVCMLPGKQQSNSIVGCKRTNEKGEKVSSVTFFWLARNDARAK